jgi:HlyD family secretion protein
MINIKNFTILSIFFTVVSCGKKYEETKPIRKDIVETVFASGILEANNTYNLVAQNEGYLISMNFNEGDIITKGKVLAEIDNKESNINTQSAMDLLVIAQNNTNSNAPLLAQAKANIDITQQKMELDAIQEQRYKRLWESNSISKIEYENILLAYKTSKTNYETAKENLKKLETDAKQALINNKSAKQVNTIVQSKNKIQAFVSGKVFEKKKQVGDFVKKGDVIAVIGDPNFIYAKLNVDESSIQKITLNQEASVQLNTNKEKTYKAIVHEILPSFDDISQSFICKLKFIEPLDFNIVKTQLQANIVIGTNKNVLLIPRGYIDFGNKVQIKDKKELTHVTTKFISSQWVQVLQGINENDILVREATTMKPGEESELPTY